jgi:hypothetical protein
MLIKNYIILYYIHKKIFSDNQYIIICNLEIQ